MKTIFVLGSLNTDLSITTNQIPTEGQTVAGSNFKTGCGGKGLNQAIAAAKLGAKVKFLGAVGDDLFGRQMLDALKHQKVDVKNVKILPKISSGIAVILLNNNNNRIVLDLGANLAIRKSDVDAFLKDAQEGDIFVAQLENNLDAVFYGLEVAKNKKMITVLNPAPANKEIEKS
ncbi:MAG: PfkB family carbohydrate kinase, partial [Coriobacteriales bacterium]|nr:PfkB family carbohydrate kinase [Coriobacteriales bacterium]